MRALFTSAVWSRILTRAIAACVAATLLGGQIAAAASPCTLPHAPAHPVAVPAAQHGNAGHDVHGGDDRHDHHLCDGLAALQYEVVESGHRPAPPGAAPPYRLLPLPQPSRAYLPARPRPVAAAPPAIVFGNFRR